MLTFQAGGAAPAQLEGVAVGAQRLLAVAVQELPDGGAAPLGSAQEELAGLRLHDLTVFVVHRDVVLQDSRFSLAVPPGSTAGAPRSLTPTTKDM